MKNKIKTFGVILILLLSTVSIVSINVQSSSYTSSDSATQYNKAGINSLLYLYLHNYEVFPSILRKTMGSITGIRVDINEDYKREDLEYKPKYKKIKDEDVNIYIDDSSLNNKINDPDDDLDQQQTKFDGTYRQIYTDWWSAQSFKPTKKTLTKIDVYIKKVKDIRYLLFVSIRKSLTGNDITRGTLLPENVPEEFDWVEVDVNNIGLETGNTYYIVIYTRAGDQQNHYAWGFGSNTGYTNGEKFISVDAGNTWLSETNKDFCFKTYGIDEEPPVANNDTFIVEKNSGSNQLDVLANDQGQEIKIVDGGGQQNGEFSFDESFVYYTPDPDFVGEDYFKYGIMDAHGTVAKAIGAIIVGGGSVEPKANDDEISVDEDSNSNIIDVLANDEGVDLTINSITNPNHGSAEIVDNKISYTPNHNYFGEDIFTYTIKGPSSKKQEPSKAEVVITVRNINDIPNIPDQPLGSTNGIEETEYEYSFKTTDIDNDDIYYKIDWDDNSPIEWAGPFGSGILYEESHVFDDPGTYNIKVKAKDMLNLESDWSEPLTVEIEDKNNPPNEPQKPSGTTEGKVDISYEYTSKSDDAEDDDIKYGWDFDGDGTVDEWTEFISSGLECSITNEWTEAGTYEVKVKAEDRNGKQSGFSSSLTVTIDDNVKPNKPQKPSGITKGKPGISYNFSTSTTDPNGDQLRYLFDWGDNSTSGWLDILESGEICKATHVFEDSGVYEIKVKAKDTDELESEWSETLSVEIIRPTLELSIKKGLTLSGKVSATVLNTGQINASNVTFTLSAVFGLRKKTDNRSKEGFSLEPGEETTIELEKLHK